jgi:hypothetical protein
VENYSRFDLLAVGSLKGNAMKHAGLLVMPAGFFLVAAALVLFPDPARRGFFACCGLLVEAIGLAVALRGHVLEQRAGRA